MKKFISILAVFVLVFTTILTIAPVSANDRNFVFEAQLQDKPEGDTLYNGMVKIDKRDNITIQIATDQPDKTYWARVEYGGAGPYGQGLRAVKELGSITTDVKGEGKGTFDLTSLVPPRVIGPHFVISSSHWDGFPDATPGIEFDTSFGPEPPPPPPPPEPGRIILTMYTNFGAFDFYMSYGAIPTVGWPNGGVMINGMTIDTGPNLSPGTYTINEMTGGYPPSLETNIGISESAISNSFSSGRLTTVNLEAGETVMVTYTNIMPAPPPP